LRRRESSYGDEDSNSEFLSGRKRQFPLSTRALGTQNLWMCSVDSGSWRTRPSWSHLHVLSRGCPPRLL